MALLMIKDPRIRSSQVRMEETNAKDYHDMEMLWKIFFKTDRLTAITQKS